MSQKPKFTKEEIIDVAFELTRKYGIDGFGARDVAKKLSSTVSPIFTLFTGMDELKVWVINKAWKHFEDYLREADEYVPAYKKRGMQMTKFATEEPKLFELILMSEDFSKLDFKHFLLKHNCGFENDVEFISKIYELTEEEAFNVYQQIWVQTYGLCTLLSKGVCSLSETDVVKAFDQSFNGALIIARSKIEMDVIMPVKKGTTEALKFVNMLPIIEVKYE